MDIAGATHVGMVRKNNEDSFKFITAYGRHLLVIADGMGGHRSGEVASSIAVNHIVEEFRAVSTKPGSFIRRVVRSAHERILDASCREAQNQGMGTTAEIVILEGDTVHIGHVGDSRVYRCSGGKLKQITEDHSYVQELINKGLLTREQAITHPRRNVITRVLGGEEIPLADVHTIHWKTGDVLLLCTDGLTNCVADAELTKILKEKSSAQDKADALVALANANGGKDNITVVVAQY